MILSISLNSNFAPKLNHAGCVWQEFYYYNMNRWIDHISCTLKYKSICKYLCVCWFHWNHMQNCIIISGALTLILKEVNAVSFNWKIWNLTTNKSVCQNALWWQGTSKYFYNNFTCKFVCINKTHINRQTYWTYQNNGNNNHIDFAILWLNSSLLDSSISGTIR